MRVSSGYGDDGDEPMADLNLIPLIDIALTLLIILMVTSAFIRQPGVSLKLPETSTREGKPETPKDFVISVAQNGDTFVGKENLGDTVLRTRLIALAQTDKAARVLIKGDKDVSYSHIMHVMDLVRQAGLVRVVLPTEPQTGAQAAPASAGPDASASTADTEKAPRP